MKTYSDKLKDPRWQKKRLTILQRDNWTCVVSGLKTETLHVHHKKYTGDPWEAPDEDLETVSETIHEVISRPASMIRTCFPNISVSANEIVRISDRANDAMFEKCGRDYELMIQKLSDSAWELDFEFLVILAQHYPILCGKSQAQ